MSLITDFYKGLDTLNLIIFWGIIIVIMLLLIFSIIISNKNKKLKKIIKNNDNQIKDESQDIPIQIKEEINIEIKEDTEKQENINKIEDSIDNLEEEKNFIAEEHVMEYNKDLFSVSNIKKTNEQENIDYEINKPKEEIKMPTGPYQRNVLREMSLNQTSPIGIVKPQRKEEKEISTAKDLQKSLSEQNEQDIEIIENTNEKNDISKEIKMISQKETLQENFYHENNQKENDIQNITKPVQKEEINEPTSSKINRFSEPKEPTSQEKYLEEVSRVLANAKQLDSVNRTEYELQQEEDAIISYEELMQKKDSIKIIDEEDAVISIEELMNKKKSEEKLYNLTEDEENEMFIKELKNFRNDL